MAGSVKERDIVAEFAKPKRQTAPLSPKVQAQVQMLPPPDNPRPDLFHDRREEGRRHRPS